MVDISELVEDVEVNLKDIYSVEPKLSEEVVSYYRSRGVGELLELIGKEDGKANCEFWMVEENTIYIITSGCHRLRALYELGVYCVPIETNKDFSKITSEEFNEREEIKLKHAPLLNKRDYKEWFEKEDGEPLPEWEPVVLD